MYLEYVQTVDFLNDSFLIIEIKNNAQTTQHAKNTACLESNLQKMMIATMKKRPYAPYKTFKRRRKSIRIHLLD